MKHRADPPPTPELYEYQVYNASHVHVATYSTAAAAASHIAAWPALYYTRVLLSTPAESDIGLSTFTTSV